MLNRILSDQEGFDPNLDVLLEDELGLALNKHSERTKSAPS